MIAAAGTTDTVMSIRGHTSTRMLARYRHSTEERKLDALEAAARLVTQ